MPVLDPLTPKIIGLCHRVSNILGLGFMEKVYEKALAFELREAKIEVRRLTLSRGKGAGEIELDIEDAP